MKNIISKKQAEDFIRAQKDTLRYIQVQNYPMTKIANALNISRQTVYRRFNNKTWTASDFIKVAKCINMEKMS